MARRPTIKDLAREAEVGVATVDRILNGRGGVREETARRVAEAAHRIGYHARGLIDQRLDHARPEVRLGFVLHKEKQEFYKNFKSEIEIAVAQRSDVRVRARILFSPSQSPDDFVSRMKEVAEDCDVIAATAVSHPSLTTAAQDLESQAYQCCEPERFQFALRFRREPLVRVNQTTFIGEVFVFDLADDSGRSGNVVG